MQFFQSLHDWSQGIISVDGDIGISISICNIFDDFNYLIDLFLFYSIAKKHHFIPLLLLIHLKNLTGFLIYSSHAPAWEFSLQRSSVAG
ncbi:MAG: hypothetical protein ACXWT0_08395, partial [Methylobacter sp.]